jgi:glycosyltransferase involved in cell wall biosynthesis
MRLLIDDAFFSLGNSGIARLWREVMKELQKAEGFVSGDIQAFVLNRTGQLESAGVQSINFPGFDVNRIDADRRLIDRVVSQYKIDIFVSTYYTWTNEAKNLGIAYDFIPEVFGFDRVDPLWLHRKVYFQKVDSIFAISRNTLSDSVAYYPRLATLPGTFALPGSDHVSAPTQLSREDDALVKDVLSKLTKPFLMTVGLGDAAYKNKSFMSAFLWQQRTDFDWVLIGGSSLSESNINEARLRGTTCIQLNSASDAVLFSLAKKSSGLVFPSLYEGYGIPVAEFIALGKRVATTKGGALVEAGGNYADYFDGLDPMSLAGVLESWSNELSENEQMPAYINQWKNFTRDLVAHMFEVHKSPKTFEPKDLLLKDATLLGAAKV